MGFVGPKGELQIPGEICKTIGLKPGDPVSFVPDPVGHTVTVVSGVHEAYSPEPLKSQNIMVGGHRASIRLEPSMWDALEQIGRRESLTVNQICTLIKERIDEQARRRDLILAELDVTLTSAVRVFIASYYRSRLERLQETGSASSDDIFTGTPLARDRQAESSTASRSRQRRSIDDVIGIGGRVDRILSQEEMDAIIRQRAVDRFMRK